MLNSGIQVKFDQISSHIRLKYKIHRLSWAMLCWTVSGHATFLLSNSNLIGYIMVVGVESPYCLCPNSKHSLVPVTTVTTGYVSIRYVPVFYFHYYRVEVCMQIMQSQHTYITIYCHHLEGILLITNNSIVDHQQPTLQVHVNIILQTSDIPPVQHVVEAVC